LKDQDPEPEPKRRKASQAQAKEAVFCPDRFFMLADDLRQWAPAISAASELDAVENGDIQPQDVVLSHIEWLEDLGQALSKPSKDDLAAQLQSRATGGWTYSAQRLLHCWRLSLVLRSVKDVQAAVERATRLALPEALADQILSSREACPNSWLSLFTVLVFSCMHTGLFSYVCCQ
jgi:hypothetical protein